METIVGCKADPDIQAHTLADTHKYETTRVAKITRKKKVLGVGVEHLASIERVLVQTEEEVEGCSINVLRNLQAQAISNIISKHTFIS